MTAGDGGVLWSIDLERQLLLPGQATVGTVTITPTSNLEVRGVVAALVATELWQYRETRTDSNGTSHTVTKTATDELQRLPVMLSGPTTLVAGAARTFPLQLPVPALGPATFDSTVLKMTWTLEIKLDKSGFDISTSVPVSVLQPTALLSAGVVRVGEFALYESADVADGEMSGTILFKPMPLCLGAPFSAVVEMGGTPPSRLKDIRMELKVTAKATVANGLEEKLLVWSVSMPATAIGTIPLEGQLPLIFVPTVQLPHGRADAVFDVVFNRSMAADDHLKRDVVLASTMEI